MLYYSLIIPHYNLPDELERLLITIPKRDDLEVIVIDDCSNKKIEKIEKLRYKYSWVKWLNTDYNGGGGKARNIGLDKIKGKFVLFADADDFFLPNFSLILDEYKNKVNLDIVYFNSISLKSDTLLPANRGREWEIIVNNYNSNVDIKSYLRYIFGEPWCKIINVDILKKNKIKFDETNIHNDTRFSYLIGYFSKNIILDKRAIYCVVEREGSVSKNVSFEAMKTRCEIFSKKNKFFKENKINIFDDLLILTFIEAKKNKLPLEMLYEISDKYGFNKLFINSKIFKYNILKIPRKIKRIIRNYNINIKNI